MISNTWRYVAKSIGLGSGLLLIASQEMEQERQAREAQEKMMADREKRIKEEFGDSASQWEQDKNQINNLAKEASKAAKDDSAVKSNGKSKDSDATSKDTSGKDTTSKDTSGKDTTSKDTSDKDTPAKDTKTKPKAKSSEKNKDTGSAQNKPKEGGSKKATKKEKAADAGSGQGGKQNVVAVS
jgi:type II secretory pathway pseudopilin PulG